MNKNPIVIFEIAIERAKVNPPCPSRSDACVSCFGGEEVALAASLNKASESGLLRNVVGVDSHRKVESEEALRGIKQ